MHNILVHNYNIKTIMQQRGFLQLVIGVHRMIL